MEGTETSTLVRPFWGRVTVIESIVDEEQRESGLIVPHSEREEGIRRGVIIDVDPTWDESGPQTKKAAEQIPQGRVVYFRRGVTIRDVVIVEIADILAYEVEE